MTLTLTQDEFLAGVKAGLERQGLKIVDFKLIGADGLTVSELTLEVELAP